MSHIMEEMYYQCPGKCKLSMLKDKINLPDVKIVTGEVFADILISDKTFFKKSKFIQCIVY